MIRDNVINRSIIAIDQSSTTCIMKALNPQILYRVLVIILDRKVSHHDAIKAAPVPGKGLRGICESIVLRIDGCWV